MTELDVGAEGLSGAAFRILGGASRTSLTSKIVQEIDGMHNSHRP